MSTPKPSAAESNGPQEAMIVSKLAAFGFVWDLNEIDTKRG